METLIDPNELPEDRHARVDDLLKKNTKPIPICIVCKEQITARHTLVETIHGPYHGWPLTCQEGR